MTDNNPAVDLDQMTVQELTALIERAEVKRRDKTEETKKALLDEFRQKAAEAGLSFESLLPGQRRDAPRPAKKLAVKYRGPKGQEWSGRGKTPDWMREAEGQGKGRDVFKV